MSTSQPGREETPCRCVEVEGYGIDRTACRADQHRNDTGRETPRPTCAACHLHRDLHDAADWQHPRTPGRETPRPRDLMAELKESLGLPAGRKATLPVDLVERVILALNRDVLNLPSTDEKVPGVEHECEPEDGDESCYLLHDQWVTRFGEHPLAVALREAMRDA